MDRLQQEREAFDERHEHLKKIMSASIFMCRDKDDGSIRVIFGSPKKVIGGPTWLCTKGVDPVNITTKDGWCEVEIKVVSRERS